METTTRSEARRAARRTALVDAAVAVFSTKGVAASSVEDIVRQAGVAKGTFYLYFETRDDVVNAVAERIVVGVADRVALMTAAPGRTPVERVLSVGAALGEVGHEPHERDLIEVLHRPENRAVHDRISERAVARIAPILSGVIAHGIALGLFRPQDPRHAAAFAMGALSALHEVVTQPEDLRTATGELNTFILRGLGYTGEIEP